MHIKFLRYKNTRMLYCIVIDEIINNNFNLRQNISTLKFSVYSDAFFKNSKDLSFPLCISSTIILTNRKSYVFSCSMFEIHFSVGFLWGIFLENIFLRCGLNSFQQLAISIPFLRFIRLFGDMLDLGLMQSIKSASLMFRFLQCGSKSKNALLPQSIECFLLIIKCCANPLVLFLCLIAYSCWYLRDEKNC